MKKLSKLASAAILAAAMGSSVAAHAGGVPVIDPANLAQSIASVENEIRQLKSMRDQIKAMTDNGNYAGILKDPTLRSYMNRYLPTGYTDIFDAASRGDLRALQKVADQIKAEDERKASSMTGKARIEANRLLTRSQIKVAMGEIDSKVKTIESVIGQINRTANPAQKADLANTLLALSSTISARIGQTQLLMAQAEQEDKAARAQFQRENHQKYRERQKQQRALRYKNSLFNK